MTFLRHYDNLGTARFITFFCFRRFRLLEDETAIRLFLNHLDVARKRYEVKIFGYVIMPEHVHFVLYPTRPVALGKVIGEFKSRSAREIFAEWTKSKLRDLSDLKIVANGKNRFVFWQKRCYDHNCRRPGTVLEKIQYCHNNPVKRSLADTPSDWKWSSYRWYAGLSDCPLEVDNCGMEVL